MTSVAVGRVAADASLAERLAIGVEGLGIDVAPAAQKQLLDFLARLAKWNAVYNLTAIRSVDDMLAVHLLDSLSVVPLIDAVARGDLLDVGSGAGLPGIPLAIVRPELAVTTIDAVAKKVSFQQQVKAALNLPNLLAIHGRVEALALLKSPSVIVSRAYTAIATMLDSVAHLADDATTIIAMKGAEPSAEIAALSPAWRVDEIRTLDVPFLGARRCAVVLRRASSSIR